MNELQPLIEFATKHFAWFPKFLMWMGIIRVVLKPFNLWLQAFLNRAVDYLRGDGYADDAAWVDRILRSRWYRLPAFLLDYFASVKLPQAPSPNLNLKVEPLINANER
jgi:hypothetical protein